MRVYLNGTSGSLGYGVAKALRAGHQVYESLADITDRAEVKNEIDSFQPEVVVHLAALVRSDVCRNMPKVAEEVNVAGTANVAQAAGAVGAKLIYFSTADVYRIDAGRIGDVVVTEESDVRPETAYAQTKYAGEAIARHAVRDAVIIRPGMTFGPRPNDTSILSDVIASHWSGRWVNVLMDPKLSKDYTASANVAEIVRLVVMRGAWGDVFNTGSGEARTYEDIMLDLELNGIRPFVKFWPDYDYIGPRVFSTEKLRKVLGYQPMVSFTECVRAVRDAAGRRHAASV